VGEDVRPAADGRPGDEMVGTGLDSCVRSFDDARHGGGAQEFDVVETVADGQHLTVIEPVMRAERANPSPLVHADRADGQRVRPIGGIPRHDRRRDRREVIGDRLHQVAGDPAHRERLHRFFDDDRVEIGTDRPVGQVGDVVRMR